jgi:hypothetical protein
MTSSRRYTERVTFEVRNESAPKTTWERKLYRRAEIVTETQTLNLPIDKELSALDPQKTRIVWHSNTGDIVLNLRSKQPIAGRRPELRFTFHTEIFELDGQPASLMTLDGDEAIFET